MNTFKDFELSTRIDRSKIEEFEQGYEYKDTFVHTEEGLNFEYTYFLEIVDLSLYEEVENKFMLDLHLVVKEKSLHQKTKDAILSGENFEIISTDMISHGYGIVSLMHEIYEVNEEQAENIALQIMNIIPSINAMRGFYLDLPFNLLGNTGWDLIEKAINNKDW